MLTIIASQEVYPDGRFRKFIIVIHEKAKKYGHWRFGGQADESHHESQAFNFGLSNPEQLLNAYNHGQHSSCHKDITLRWVPGDSDPYQIARLGTVSRNVYAIAAERAVLGLPPLLADETPVSGTSVEPCLVRCKAIPISSQWMSRDLS